jgi:hypothetical protein
MATQEKAMFQIKPVLEEATREVYTALLPKTMVVADLGCSSGPNTLRFVSEVIGIIARHCKELDRRHDRPPQLQFFLNDLPGNDFNNLFQLIEQFNKSTARKHKGEAEAGALPPSYITGLPGSYYTRIFPSESVHLFHSLFCLQWRSQVCMHAGKMQFAHVFVFRSWTQHYLVVAFCLILFFFVYAYIYRHRSN